MDSSFLGAFFFFFFSFFLGLRCSSAAGSSPVRSMAYLRSASRLVWVRSSTVWCSCLIMSTGALRSRSCANTSSPTARYAALICSTWSTAWFRATTSFSSETSSPLTSRWVHFVSHSSCSVTTACARVNCSSAVRLPPSGMTFQFLPKWGLRSSCIFFSIDTVFSVVVMSSASGPPANCCGNASAGPAGDTMPYVKNGGATPSGSA
mmetsp:Transcript_15836/g.28046  ORF Transcript_15836/g.28046 Transcript_15836/m.28046 type:complete len:206 (-) Transcript_15836:201-818(-)